LCCLGVRAVGPSRHCRSRHCVLDQFLGLQVPIDVRLYHQGGDRWSKCLWDKPGFLADEASAVVECCHQQATFFGDVNASIIDSQYISSLTSPLLSLHAFLAMGLAFGWKSLQWVSAVPPILVVLVFKTFLSRTFSNSFRYYVPSEEEVKNARIHSARADVKGNRLANRFGHPVMHSELFTPMVSLI
jgi:hypothetical protein